jgi:hypothetical protein
MVALDMEIATKAVEPVYALVGTMDHHATFFHALGTAQVQSVALATLSLVSASATRVIKAMHASIISAMVPLNAMLHMATA